MAKVYDALRRADQERKRRAGDDLTSAAPLKVEPVALVPKLRRPPLWRRILTRRRRPREDPGGGSEINKRRIAIIQPDSYVAEQYRALRGRIDAMTGERKITTIIITSAFAGEGKTTAAVNLAAVTALSLGRRVLLIDCDMRKPKVHSALGLQPRTGLAEVLRKETTLESAIMKVDGGNFEVLAVRGRPSNPSELLGSQEMRNLIDEVSERYDRVIFDSPAGLGLPDAKVVSDLADGIVLVVRADSTTDQDVATLLDVLGRERVLGLLLNGAKVDQAQYGYATT